MSRLDPRTPLAALALALALAGCGGASSDEVREGLPGEAIASVGGKPIAKAELVARERFEALQASRTVPLRRPPVSKLPTVFPYLASERECAAAVRRAIDPKQGSKLTGTQLREYCKSTAARIREYAINGVLGARVTAAEAAARDIAIEEADVEPRLRVLHAAFGGSKNLAAYTRRTGVTASDLRRRASNAALGGKLQAAILSERGAATDGGKPRQAWADWQAATLRKWRPRIECRKGYDAADLCGPSRTSR